MWLRNTIQLLYGIPGILLYLLAFYAIYGIRKSISCSFLVIYIIMASSNIATWLNAWLFLKLVNEPDYFFYYQWIATMPQVLNIQSFLVSHFYYVQNINLLLLTFDRFAAIYYMGNENTWWKKYFGYITIACQVLAFGINLAIRLPMVTLMYFDSVNERFVAVQPDATNENNALSKNIQLGFGVLTFIVCFIFNVAISLKLLHKLKMLKSTTTEKYFFVFSVSIFISQFLNLIIAALVVILQQWKGFLGIDLHTIFEFTYFTSDLFSIGPALYLVLLPGPVRKYLGTKYLGICLVLSYYLAQCEAEPMEMDVYISPQTAMDQYNS